MEISRELYIKSDGISSMHVSDISYTKPTGKEMIRTLVKRRASFVGAERTYYPYEMYQQHSFDGGISWENEQMIQKMDPNYLDGLTIWQTEYLLDENKNVLIMFYSYFEQNIEAGNQFSYDGFQLRTKRLFYQISTDEGRTWSRILQIVDKRKGFTSIDWAPGIAYGKSGAETTTLQMMADGSILIGIHVINPIDADGVYRLGRSGVVFAKGVLSDDLSHIEWRFGDLIMNGRGMPPSCCEPTAVYLGEGRVFCAMRSQGVPEDGIYSGRTVALSKDSGMTWSEPELLRYDDGEIVYNPAAYATFFSSEKTEKVYFISNILDEPVFAQIPRYPLHIAEFDTKNLCIIRNSIKVIQHLPQGAPEERRYSNWAMYEERGTKDLILILPEEPKYVSYKDMKRPEDMQADCIKYRIKF